MRDSIYDPSKKDLLKANNLLLAVSMIRDAERDITALAHMGIFRDVDDVKLGGDVYKHLVSSAVEKYLNAWDLFSSMVMNDCVDNTIAYQQFFTSIENIIKEYGEEYLTNNSKFEMIKRVYKKWIEEKK